MNCAFGNKAKMGKGSDFRDLIFSWSLEHILNEDLYKNQVDVIPKSFQSVEEYLGSYVYPLLEETRAELAASMDIMSRAPFAEVISIADASKPSDKRHHFHVTVDYWRNRFSERGKEPYKTLPGDIVMFCDVKPETSSDLQRVGTTWSFASVTTISEDQNEEYDTSAHFKVIALKDIGDLEEMQKSVFVLFLMNLTTNKRIWNALHMRRNTNMIQKVLCNDPVVEDSCSRCPVYSNVQLTEMFDRSILSGLNVSQTEAILGSLLKLKCEHKVSVELIWGPPGTGKTKTVSVMLLALLKMNCRTVVCAPTNVAITEVASRMLKLRSESESEPVNFGDILLFGNKDRLKLDSDIEEIFLDHRVKSLLECLVPVTGWRHCITSMMDLLKDCVSQYQVFVENEKIKAEEATKEGVTRKTYLKVPSKTFLMFLRDRFRATASHLRRCLQIFTTHLPIKFLQDVTFQNIVCLIDLLEKLEALLFQEKLVSKNVEELFSQTEVEDSLDSLVDTSLMYVRSKCFSILQDLRWSLERLKLPSAMSEDSIKEFCFQRASLFLCTASTSYKLHEKAIEPLNLVVIDEAAQLKECESTIPLQLPGVRHSVLIGDECQLPAMVTSKSCEEAGYGRSLFERMSSLGHPKHLLNIQYRMHPQISFFPNTKFYLNQILDAPAVRSKSYVKHYLPGPMFGPYSFINIVGGKEEAEDVSHSLQNMVEVAVVAKLLQYLYKAWTTSQKSLSIGVISPYVAQVAAIQDKIGNKYENLDGFSVQVKSVDGFQGGEKDITILSTVRSNSGGNVGFLSSLQRTNVSLTRARHCLWILGNERTLLKSDSVWDALVRDAKSRNCFFNADDDKNIAKAILDAKKELDQLDDLLNPDSLLFKNERWKVLFSDNFKRSFGKLKSSRMKKSVINLLLKLSSGWRPKYRNVDIVCESSLQVIKQFKVEGLYVVCTVDIVKESMYMQVLKVWDVLPLEEIPKLSKRLDSIFSICTDEILNRCNEKCLEGDLEVPKSWVLLNGIERFKSIGNNESVCDPSASVVDGRSYVENSRVSESLLLMKFYSLSSGVVSHLLSDRDGIELDLPFEVTDKEREIILFPKSSFILGRSGTGKTTVLTMKLFQKEYHFHIASQGYYTVQSSVAVATDLNQMNDIDKRNSEVEETVLRQLFVTVSPKLCYAVKQQVSHLKSFARGGNTPENTSADIGDVDDSSQFEDIPDSFVNIPSKKYPLVLTFHKFIMMLDGTLGSSYFERFPDVRDKFHDKFRSIRSVELLGFIRMKEVNYDRFCSFYWPHFNADLTKKLEPSRVFTEIISYIKGGFQTGKLVRDDYLLLSDSRVSTLSRQNRDIIYDIFQNYEKMKMERGEFDLADIVIDLHLRLKNQIYEGDKMDFVYIDEVQDLTMRQISLFKYVCRNIDEGFVFSGDTAQTIARGIDFRFQDIRSLFYKEFMSESRSNEFAGNKEKRKISEIFKLQQNFRTHAGVLNLAQSVIDLLYRFFPHTIDILEPETSLISGECPVLLDPGNDENAIVTIFGNSGSVGGKMVGFGAEQVILVRDDDAKRDISDYVGKQALLLNIVECKGLEFQDVLLYNFFGSSPLKNQWRIVYEYMEEQDLLDSTCPQTYPCFNETKHNVLGSELKQLYVAITRTRQRLWICENKEDLSKPMFDYWKRKGLVQVRKLDDSLAQAMQVASSPEEWKARGIKLFWEGNYEMATMCFERAGDTMWEKRAKASGFKAAADRLRISKPEDSSSLLRQAADLFVSIGKSASAAECFYDLGEFEKAGNTYEKCGESGMKKAAECFTLAKCYDRAADTYANGNYFQECLLVCTKGKLFDMGLQYIEHWKLHALKDNGLVDRTKEIEKMEQEFLESCALNYHLLKDHKSMMKFVRAFPSFDLRRNFLKSRDCMDELLLLEEEAGNFAEAAEIARSRGDILREADLLEKAGNCNDASLLILWFVFFNSLNWVSGSNVWPLKEFLKKQELLNKATSFAKKESAVFYDFVYTEVKTFSHEKSNLLELLKSLCFSREHKSLRGEILSARKMLDIHLQLHTSKYEWVNEVPSDMVKHSEDKMSQNRVSAETLLYSWNIWKDQIISVFEYLQCLETQELVKHIGHGEFCLNYFGVRRQISNLNVIYVLVNPDANWVKRIDERSLEKNGKLVCIDAQQFVPAARSYWQRELFSIGMKILEKLEALYKWSTKSSMFRQSMCLLQIFEVAKFLTGCQFLDSRQHNSSTLQNFLDWSIKSFVRIVFPLDWRLAVNKDIISLREMDLSHKLLEEAIRKNININLKEDVTYGRVGRVMMILLGSGRPGTYLFEKIISRLKGTWMTFAQDLYPFEISDSKAPLDGNRDIVDASSLIYNYHKALEETYNINRRMFDYISPKCFLYHVDRLLIMASHFRGLILTTKSSFLEWFLHHPSVANSRSGSLNMNLSSEAIFDFVVNMVLQSLYNMHDTEVWISGSDTNMKWYYPLLVLKLFVILSLVCLNSRKYYGALFNLLERGDITSLLPREFYIILRRSKGRNRLYLNERIVSEAFKTIGDPLVIASSEKPHSNIVAPEAIFVDIGVPISKEEIMRLMFPSTVQQEHNAIAAEVGPTNPDAVEDPTSNDDAGKNSNGAFMSTQNVDLKIENEALLMDWEVFNEISESLNSAGKKGNFVLPNVTNVKGQLEKNINVLSVAMNRENKTNEEDLSVIGDAKRMIDELKKMLSALDMSENKLEDISSILKNLQSRRQNVEKFLKNRSLINAEDSSVKSEEKALDSNSVDIDEVQCHKEDDDGDDGITEGTSDSTAVRETSACETQTKGKKSKANNNKPKANNKPKKGKKGKKK